MKRTASLLAALALGCAGAGSLAGRSAPPSDGPRVSLHDKVWAKADMSYAGPGDYERAEAACRGRDGLPDVAAGPDAPRAFIDCMGRHGWALVDKP